MPATLDEIFDKVIDIGENSKSRISILLCEPSDQKDQYEIVDIDIEGENPSFPIRGLNDSNSLMISSWIRKVELNKIKKKNKNFNFIVEVV